MNLRQTNSALVRGPRRKRAFTLIELLVVVAIITIVSAVILANNNKFGGAALLQNLAYDVALSVREAQVYGISVKQTSAGTFNSGYGMHFDITTLQNSETYHLFADVALTGTYKSGEDVSPSPYAIGQGFYIYKLCATLASNGVEDCTTPTKLDILFIRPEPDACISVNGTSQLNVNGSYVCNFTYTSARIVLTSPRGDFMDVIIYANGQISVQSDAHGA